MCEGFTGVHFAPPKREKVPRPRRQGGSSRLTRMIMKYIILLPFARISPPPSITLSTARTYFARTLSRLPIDNRDIYGTHFTLVSSHFKGRGRSLCGSCPYNRSVARFCSIASPIVEIGYPLISNLVQTREHPASVTSVHLRSRSLYMSPDRSNSLLDPFNCLEESRQVFYPGSQR
ncbi:hypothetical protein LshimejAT787_0901530 [Lyophyllum shimeji]|uniref:Uncharacterized protein n=1 Tax=Lyophyllum shimeji TaxID=47721 RepID=A0A9P3PST9_LYOSH|nr:hypothetical protein LshimejAT787_0901530 [Lyophyllum shimeji]